MTLRGGGILQNNKIFWKINELFASWCINYKEGRDHLSRWNENHKDDLPKMWQLWELKIKQPLLHKCKANFILLCVSNARVAMINPPQTVVIGTFLLHFITIKACFRFLWYKVLLVLLLEFYQFPKQFANRHLYF